MWIISVVLQSRFCFAIQRINYNSIYILFQSNFVEITSKNISFGVFLLQVILHNSHIKVNEYSIQLCLLIIKQVIIAANSRLTTYIVFLCRLRVDREFQTRL